MKKNFRSGFVTIIGRANVGKSTLLNAMVGQKIAIISDKPQTTRNRIHAVYTTEDFQIIFLDTPGIHKPRNKLGKFMVKTALTTLNEVDVIVYVVEVDAGMKKGDRYILDMLSGVTTPVILAINKIDKTNKQRVEEVIQIFRQEYQFADTIPISALRGDNLNILRGAIVDKLEEGPLYFPEDMVTDQPERFIISEIIREKALHLLEQEVPHGIAVDIESMETDEYSRTIKIYANIYCEKESHKGIIVGREGKMLKEIGSRARLEIEALLGSRVYLDLWVKVKKNWRNVDGSLNIFGYQ